MISDVEMFNAAVECVVESGKATITNLQRELRISYPKAKALMECLEIEGIVSESSMNGGREVLAIS